MGTGRPDPDDVGAGRGEVGRHGDALAAPSAAVRTRPAARRRVWRTAVGLLVVIGTLSFTLSAVGWWARRNLADTDVWIERVGPLANDPAVQAALGDWLGDEVMELVDPAAFFVEVLPERGRVLAVPLAGAVEDFVRSRVDRFVASDRFEQLWLAANERAHRATIQLLRGEGQAARAQGDTVVINLVPAINAALADLSSASPELLGREVDLPDLSVDDVPDAAIARLEQALGVDLGDDFGQFVVYDRGRLRALQDAVDQARRWLVVLSVMTVAAFGGALLLSDRRRRTLLQMLVGLAIGLALIRRVGLRGQSELLSVIRDDLNRDATEAVSDAFLDPLLAVTQTLLIGIAVVAGAVLVSGPYSWAVRLRRRTLEITRGLGRNFSRAETAASSSAAGTVWVRRHRSELQIGGTAIIVLALLVFDLSFLGIVALGGLAALGGIILSRIPEPVDTG